MSTPMVSQEPPLSSWLHVEGGGRPPSKSPLSAHQIVAPTGGHGLHGTSSGHRGALWVPRTWVSVVRQGSGPVSPPWLR